MKYYNNYVYLKKTNFIKYSIEILYSSFLFVALFLQSLLILIHSPLIVLDKTLSQYFFLINENY